MSHSALVLTYHAVEDGPPPLCVPPALFDAHLERLEALGATLLTVAELAAALESDSVPQRAVALTFDDGLASVADTAAPLLRARGMRATVFCVAGHIGGENDWPTQPAGVGRSPLAAEDDIARLAADGWEIGSHGFAHRPLDITPPEALEEELVQARAVLERVAGHPVTSYAYPYGAPPSERAREVVGRTYRAACATGLRLARPGDDLLAIPRVDAHYLRRVELLDRAVTDRGGAYLTVRRAGAWARRLVARDYDRDPA